MMKVGEMTVENYRMKRITVNGLILGVPSEVGPRVLFLAAEQKPDFNFFGSLPDFGVPTDEGVWKILGGHRLWSSPEARPRSYSPDDKPVKIEAGEDGVVIHGNPERENGLLKTIRIRPVSGGVVVSHEIRNIGRWEIEIACWALSVMRTGGFAVVPLNTEQMDPDGLLPDRRISLWPYTDLTDPRLTLGKELMILRQDPAATGPIKIGMMARPAWAAYCVAGWVFVKRFQEQKLVYPDYGCNVEVFTNNAFLELETVGPLTKLAPGATMIHEERWYLRETGPVESSEADVRKKIVPLVGEGEKQV